MGILVFAWIMFGFSFSIKWINSIANELEEAAKAGIDYRPFKAITNVITALSFFMLAVGTIAFGSLLEVYEDQIYTNLAFAFAAALAFCYIGHIVARLVYLTIRSK